ncbi:SMR family transporter [Photobacterium sp. SDRW27]|uniref:DMT family transporter n=1 Tax=Photobacterium obscurum TaxID=2829490 RepID=UPI002243826C|nr:SMR family transporter [Photobacterium obscurum]MCW8327456.1 SMR family transporter [Photobacterium obscurum]
MMKWLILIVGVLSNASASALIKVAMTPPRKLQSFSDPMSLLQNWPLWLGLFLYGTAFVLYALALTRLPLNVAHPILTSGSIAIVALFSSFFFGEQLSIINMMGIVLIIAGVFALTLN